MHNLTLLDDLTKRLKEEFPNNFEDEKVIEPMLYHEMMGLSSFGYNSMFDVGPDLDPDTEAERIVRNLFEQHPKVKIYKISFKPRFTEDDRGGTLTISGSF